MRYHRIVLDVGIGAGYRSQYYENRGSIVLRIDRAVARAHLINSKDSAYSYVGEDQHGRPVLVTFLDKKGLGGEDEIEEQKKNTWKQREGALDERHP